ncbi:MAG TPA: transglutaminase domain-containing protein [Myxococcaceae bacterium]|nr:transglutaminase domain-containing protein [Myxococcaceae bacterium]
MRRALFIGTLLLAGVASAQVVPGGMDPLSFARLPDSLQLVLELGGSPAGVVTLSRNGRDYSYRSQHFFNHGTDVSERVRAAAFEVGRDGLTSEGRAPGGLWLWRRPAPGCVEGLDELSGETGTFCAEADGADLTGTMGKVAFRASYGGDGVLSTLVLPDATLRRVPLGSTIDVGPQALQALERVMRNPPGTGALRWKNATFDASVKGLTPWNRKDAEALSKSVDRSFRDKRQGPADFSPERVTDTRGGCLAHARRFALQAKEQGKTVGIVHGLVFHQGALRPHAWVRVALEGGGTLELDPMLGKLVTPSTYLPLGATTEGSSDPELGRRWLRVLSGNVEVARGGR